MPKPCQTIRFATAAAILASAHAVAGTIPMEFESAAPEISPLYAYFGGVGGISIASSTTIAHSGQSNAITVQWQPDSFFSLAGAAVGDRLINGADLIVPALPTIFHVAILTPQDGAVTLEVVLREDDNGDGVIDPLADDDEWRTVKTALRPGRAVYNFELASFFDANAEGDGVQNFDTTGAVGVEFIVETRESLPGGMLTTPATYFVDHVGFSTAPASLPLGAQADVTVDGVVSGDDLAALLAAWGGGGAGDLNGDGVVDGVDLAALLSVWGPIEP